MIPKFLKIGQAIEMLKEIINDVIQLVTTIVVWFFKIIGVLILAYLFICRRMD